ncbi:MAG: hypothetical protein J5685_02500 [Clostridiales bacterium]|nr:hypothetical protein [Clostridiales bacterium]
MDSYGIRKEMSDRFDLISKLVREAEIKIGGFPEGRVKIHRRGDRLYFYLVDDSTGPSGRLLKEQEADIAQMLFQKDYLQKIIKSGEQETISLKKALELYPETVVEKVYDTLPPERQGRVKPIVLSDEMYINNWLSRPYKKKAIAEGIPFFETRKGERVRSKSEQIIADRLAANNIPYKYERPLKLKDGIIHPDFTILRMSDRKEIYLEHNGRMDDPGYAEDKAQRTNRYIMSGILPGRDLIQLFETKAVPLDVRVLDVLIKECFT